MSSFSLIVLSIFAAFNTAAALGPAAVNLGTAANYVILAKSGVSTVFPSAITGNIGVSPIAATALTGFSLTLDASGTFSTSTQVVGQLFAASYTSPTPITLTTAISDSETAFTDAISRVNPNFTNLRNGALGGLVLSPGLYQFPGSVGIGNDVTITGSATDTWIFQISGTFSIAAGKKVILAGGALAENIVWVVTGVTSFQAGSHVEGILLSKTAATLVTGTTMNGRILTQTFVALQEATLVAPSS